MDRARRPAHATGLMARAALAVALALALAAAPGAAVPESDAAQTRLAESGLADVARVWHEPEPVEPLTQWQGHIQFRADHNVSDVLYQICRVGTYCFAPPTPAERVNDTFWRFNTSDYVQPGSGKPVQYEAGWRVGYQFLLVEGDNTTLFPHGIEPSDPSCQGEDAWMVCAETHYFAFTVAGTPGDRGAPGPGPLMALSCLALAALSLAARGRAGQRR